MVLGAGSSEAWADLGAGCIEGGGSWPGMVTLALLWVVPLTADP